MNAVQPRIRAVRMFRSGEEVDPGVYIDMDSGDVVKVNEKDALPEGIQVIRYLRRFRRVEGVSETRNSSL